MCGQGEGRLWRQAVPPRHCVSLPVSAKRKLSQEGPSTGSWPWHSWPAFDPGAGLSLGSSPVCPLPSQKADRPLGALSSPSCGMAGRCKFPVTGCGRACPPRGRDLCWGCTCTPTPTSSNPVHCRNRDLGPGSQLSHLSSLPVLGRCMPAHEGNPSPQWHRCRLWSLLLLVTAQPCAWRPSLIFRLIV